MIYDDDDYNQGYAQIKEAFRASTKDDIPQLYLSDNDFRSSNVGVDDAGYIIFVFEVRFQQIFTASQRIEEEFKYNGVVPNDVNGYALVLTNKLISINNFDLS